MTEQAVAPKPKFRVLVSERRANAFIIIIPELPDGSKIIPEVLDCHVFAQRIQDFLNEGSQ